MYARTHLALALRPTRSIGLMYWDKSREVEIFRIERKQILQELDFSKHSQNRNEATTPKIQRQHKN
jgi:hypothetical protein